ncbi:ester cyclase [Shewanella sp. 10N.286.45.A1]|uniref:ester cyclase n=1 Tax=Shewanella sp. 10N.286.45.A1 TaxID=3229694 RepID=UPI003551A72A
MRHRLAKHVGDFFGMPASNKTAYYAGHDIFQLNGKGQIIEIWHIEQIFQLMQQLKPQ